MNLSKLFQIQKELDEAIIEKKGLQGKDLLPERILALQVELGECANEWRGFKFWSEDPYPRIEKYELKDEYKHLHITQTGAYEYQLRDEFGKIVFDDVTDYHHKVRNPLLEEYVDVLHFVLSIGNHHLTEEEKSYEIYDMILPSVTHQFTELLMVDWSRSDDTCGAYRYNTGLKMFVALGEMLGFTWEEIEQAYLDKNKINHERQVTGY